MKVHHSRGRGEVSGYVGAIEPQLVGLYENPPQEELSMKEFEQLSFNRLAVLQEIDAAYSKHLKPDELGNRMNEIVQKIPLQTAEDGRNDCVSHFALRLAFLKQPAEQHWFIRQECSLLRFRLEYLLKRGKLETSKILHGSGLEYPRLNEATFQKHQNDLDDLLPYQVRKDPNRPALSMFDFFLVPFERALDLVARRKCLLVQGNAFVYKTEIVSVIVAQFQETLEASLLSASALVPPTTHVAEDDRVGTVLAQLTQQRFSAAASTAEIGSWKAAQIDIRNIDQMAQKQFPLCMQHLHFQLRKTHKLKHMGRMQYGLFLKGIGVTLEDSLYFWKQELTRVIAQKQFDQEYAYNIRHNYGQEGRRADYTPYGCSKIINSGSSAQSADLAHGCPFKNFSQAQLTNQLQAAGASPAEQSEIFQHLTNKHYQMGCKKYFELTHPGCKKDFLINHPNQYFKYSTQYQEHQIEK